MRTAVDVPRCSFKSLMLTSTGRSRLLSEFVHCEVFIGQDLG